MSIFRIRRNVSGIGSAYRSSSVTASTCHLLRTQTFPFGEGGPPPKAVVEEEQQEVSN